jgi:hypothetical protein
MYLFMSNNGAKQNTHTHNCVSPPGKVFFDLISFLRSFAIETTSPFPFLVRGIVNAPLLLFCLAQRDINIMIEFNGVQGPVYLFLTHGREKKETQKFRF